MKKTKQYYFFIKNNKDKLFEIKGPTDDDRAYTKMIVEMPKYMSCFTVSPSELEKSILELKNNGYKHGRK